MPTLKKIASYTICILLIGFAWPLSAQRVTTFQAVIPGLNSNDYSFPKSIISLPDKGFIGSGLFPYTTPGGPGGDYPVIFRLDSLGREAWIKSCFANNGVTNNIEANTPFTPLVRVSDSVFAFALSLSGGDSTILTEMDYNGKVLWTRDYDIRNFTGFYSFVPTSLTTTPTGGLLIAGGLLIDPNDTLNDQTLLGSMGLISVNDTGGVIWAKAYINRSDTNYYFYGNFHVNRVINCPGGGYLVNGIKVNGANQNGHYTNDSVLSFVYKVSANGTLLWHKCYGFHDVSDLYTLSYQGNSDITMAPGAIYVASQDTAYEISPTKDSFHVINILKLDTSGNMLWAHGYSKMEGAGISLLYDSAKNSLMLSSYIDTLYYRSNPPGMFLARLDTAGNFKYIHLFFNMTAAIGTQSYGGDGNICKTPNGYAMIGENGIPNFCVVKTDSAGLTNGCATYNVINRMRKETFTQHTQFDRTVNMDVKAFHRTNPGIFLTNNPQVLCEPFVAGFGWQDTCAGATTAFLDSTYTGATNWYWDFGDPASGSANNTGYESFYHIYNKPGTYKVKLVVSNGINKDSITRLVHIAPSPRAFIITDTTCAGDSVNLVADTGGVRYSWNSAVMSDSTKQSAWAYPYQDTILAVNITNTYGCSIIDSFRIKVPPNCAGIGKASGIINKYAAVLSVDSCLNEAIVDTASFFKEGDSVLLIQMKGATIDTTNDSTFGTIKNIGGAGLYEYNTVDSIGGNNIYFRYKFQNQYNASGFIQLVSIPQYTNLIITDTMKAMLWNGTKGGVLIFNATGIVIMGAPINVSGQGFLGGALDSGGTTCHKSDYYYSNTSSFGANKGEGITTTKTTLSRGRGANANGGGGGDSYEAGGGGGANAGTGGQGGNEMATCGSPIVNGGIGGFGLNNYTGQNRVFMGGGGGSGFYHSSSATPGTNGGGIIMINALKVACDGNSLFANGASQNLKAVLDAAGGGGGGGSIVLNVKNLAMNTPISANGGNGGNDSFRFCMGPGGGGGGGTLQLKSNSLIGNISFLDSGGVAGKSLSKLASCYNSNYGADPGQKGGIVTGISVSNGNKLFARPYASIFSASVTDSTHVQLSFEKSVNPYVVGYKIYRQIGDGAYTNISTISHPQSSPIIYNDAIGTAKDSFSYQVYTIDTCGDVSTYSDTHTTVHLQDTVHGCEQAIHLNWNRYAGWPVKKYEIYRATNGTPETLLAIVNSKITSFKDSSVNYHNLYCYRVLAYDSIGPYESWSEKTCGQTYFLDTAKIMTATKTVTSAVNGTVVIRWQGIKGNAYMAVTELYYSTNGKNYTLLATLPPTQDSFVQTGINTKTADAFYYLKNIDSCGTVSDSSVINKTMTLNVNVGELLHKLNWTPYFGFKIKTYQIERLEKGVFVTIDSVPGTDTSSREFPAPCNYAIYYRIAAVGYDSGQLAWSDTVGKQALDTVPPNAAKIKSLLVLNTNNVQLNFISSDSSDVYKYIVQRSVNGVWNSGSDFITHLHGASSTYIDTINTTSNQLCYTVITLDSCLNAAESDTICAESLNGKALNCKAEVTLSLPKITSPPSVPDSFVVYKSTDNVNYNKITELPVTAITYIDTNVSVGISYFYKLEAVYTRIGMDSYSDTLRMVPTTIPDADSAQLIYATIIKSDETRGAILIQWKRALPNDTNARGYYVYSYNPTNGKYALLKDVTNLNDTSYIQDNLNTIQNAYKYYIITYNVCDVGINSNIHKTVLLKVQNNNLSEQLNWTNYLGVGVKSYSVYKSEDGGSQNLLANAGIDSLYSDSGVVCNHNFTYQVQAILANGEISFSDSVTVKSFDTIRPKTSPMILATVIKTNTLHGSISLSWNAATDNNLQGYNIYRSNDGNGWILISQYSGTSLIDTGLDTYDQPYYYKIQPVDSCGNVGAYTTYHETIHLKASAGNGYNQLYWNGYAGWQVKQYLVYKNGNLVATLGNNVFAFKDTAVICQDVYQYLIKAIDSVNDTIASSSNTDSAKAQNHNPPKAVYVKTVSVSSPNKAVTISWSPSTSYDIKDYVIYRKAAIDGSIKFVDSTSLTTYTDSSETVTEPDCYYVFARNHCGNLSNGSNEGCIIILSAKNQPGYNDLSWNSYQNWPDGVQSYNVYKQEDSSGWQMIGTVSSVQTNEFEDKNLGDSTISFCYQVEAIENQGQYNQLSRSTVECVHQDATVFIPNSFTPYNADGVNDLFGPKGLYIKDYDMNIYNRWGELVYSKKIPLPPLKGGIVPQPDGWDGTYKGQPVQQGIYIYLITVEDYNGKKSYFKGTITMFE